MQVCTGNAAYEQFARLRERQVIEHALRSAVKEGRSDLLAEGWGLAVQAGIVDPSSLVRPFERSYHWRRGNSDGSGRGRNSGRANPDRLDLYDTSKGTFTRTSEGLTVTGAESDGATKFTEWAPANWRRIQYAPGLPGNTGLILEPSRTNIVLQNSDMSTGAWSAGVGTLNVNDTTAPDQSVTADRWQNVSGAYSQYQSIGGLTTVGTKIAVSAYQKRRSGAGNGPGQLAYQDGVAGTGTAVATTLTEAWQRVSLIHTALGGSQFYVPADGRAGYGGAIVNTALDYQHVWHQVEAGYWPSSPVRTTASSATRAGDALSYATGQYPERFRTRGMRVYLMPLASSAEIIQSETEIPASGTMRMRFGAGVDLFDIVRGGATCNAYAFAGGALKVTRAMTFSRYQPLMIETRNDLGTITIAGATTGNGTSVGAPWVWPTGTFTLSPGGVATNCPMFAIIAQYIEVP